MKAIIKRAFEPVGRVIEIDNELKALQEAVGGYIECVRVGFGTVIICDEEGRLKGKPLNCRIGGVSFVGTILAVGEASEEFTDVPIDLDTWEGWIW